MTWTTTRTRQAVFNPLTLELNTMNLKSTEDPTVQLQGMQTPLYINRTSIWAIVLYIILFTFIYKLICKKLKNKSENNQIEIKETSIFK